MLRRRPVSLGLALLLSAALAGCSSDDAVSAAPTAVEQESPALTAEPTEEPTPSPSAAAPSPAAATPAPSAIPSAAPAPTPAATPAKAAGYDVAAVQRQLTEQRYYVGPVDGKAGPALASSVMAFQKINGLGADGAVGPATLAALAAPKAPQLRASSPANRVEVDLDKQVLYVVKGGALNRIMPVSSGNGATYRQKDGSTARALTPTGWYEIERRIVGERKADLGTLYDPQYFYKGWAIHGSNSVPAGPASHGCVRVTRTDAKWLLTAIGNGMPVYLYGGKHVFSAGSGAPGTDNPSGDGGGAPAPAPAAPKPAPPAPKPAPPAPTTTTPPPTTAPPSPPTATTTAPPAEPTATTAP